MDSQHTPTHHHRPSSAQAQYSKSDTGRLGSIPNLLASICGAPELVEGGRGVPEDDSAGGDVSGSG